MICEPKHKFRPETGDRAGNRQSCDGCHMARDPGYLSHLLSFLDHLFYLFFGPGLPYALPGGR